MNYYIGLQGKLLAQGIDLDEHKVIYDADDNLLLVNKADNTFDICCKDFLKPNKERDIELVKQLDVYTNESEAALIKCINHLKSCSVGLGKLEGLNIGTNINATICNAMGFICAKGLGNAILGVREDGMLILSRKEQIEVVRINELTHDNVLIISVLINDALRAMLSGKCMQAMIAITIEDLCAQACKIDPELNARKFKDIGRYFTTKDLDSDYVHNLEKEFEYNEKPNVAYAGLTKKILTTVYSIDGLISKSRVGTNKESIVAREAWMIENFGNNWKEIIKTTSPSFSQIDVAKEYENIVLSTVVFEATKMIHEAKRPICKENNITAMYLEIFNPMVKKILAINKPETLREDIRNGLKKYFEEPTVDKHLPGMSIFENKNKYCADGSLNR